MNAELILQVNQFYFREARLLDDRCYQQWLALLSDKIEYTVPARHVVQLDNSKRETEAFLNREQEFSGSLLSQGMEPPLRDEKYLHLMIRVMRSLKMNAWTENPPARTRRHVGNIEIIEATENTLTVYSNTLLYYSRHEHNEHLYSYQRKDVLEKHENDFRLLKREVLLDCVVIPGASAGLFF
jgi:3-phenylpropionate/cinnamic acid dioxygenase small subunit